jgi:hypothetical protein
MMLFKYGDGRQRPAPAQFPGLLQFGNRAGICRVSIHVDHPRSAPARIAVCKFGMFRFRNDCRAQGMRRVLASGELTIRMLKFIAAAALCAVAFPAGAQDQKPGLPFYQVRFAIHDNSDPTVSGVRNYTMIVASNRKGVFSAGDRVPITTASETGSAGNGPSTQFTYIDVGVNIECLISEAGGKLELQGVINMTALERRDGRPSGGGPNPTIGQTKLDLDTAVDIGKPTIVAAIDDPLNSRKIQVEATVTKVQ